MGTGLAHIASDSQAGARHGRWAGVLVAAALLAVAIGNQAPAAAPAADEPLVAADQLLPTLGSQPATEPRPGSAGGSSFELTLGMPDGGDVKELLTRAGAAAGDAAAAAALVRLTYPDGVPPGSDVKLTLDLGGGDRRPIKRLAILSDLGALTIVPGADGRLEVESRDTLRQFTVPIEGDAYWSLRRAGIDGQIGAEAKLLLPSRATAGTLRLVVGDRPERFSERSRSRLLYVAWSGSHGERRWLRWDEQPGGWLELGAAARAEMVQPVAGPMTSAFGLRRHPILGFARFHRGVDFAAAWGSPVRAAADGVVAAAGWRGGYGRQVQLVHAGANTTSYSHLSQMVVEPGARVRRGQLIGYVGASGLATGPHLHFEVVRGGRPVDPLHGGGVGGAAADPRVAALVERLVGAPSA